MIIAEAEELYKIEVAEYRKQHALGVRKSLKIWNIISVVVLIIGIVLIIVGLSLPPETDLLGTHDSIGALMSKTFGSTALILGIFLLIFGSLCAKKTLQNGPRDYTTQVKNLYLNYLKCSDMSDTDKEFYVQKLEEIRNAELVSAIRSAGLSASAALMFTVIKK